MKLQIETPPHLVDVNRLPLDRIEETADGGLRIGALVRNSDLAADPRVRQRYPRAEPRAARRRLGPAAQQGHHRRQPAAAHALLLFLRHRQALQQARARLRLRGARRLQPHPRDPRRERRTASPRTRPTWRSRCGRSTPRSRRSIRPAAPSASRSPTSTACPATRRRSRPSLEPGELITAVTLPPPSAGRADLSQGARPRLLRLRAGFGRRHRRCRGAANPLGAARLRRAGAQALARRTRPRRRWPAPPRTGECRRRGRRRARRRARLRRQRFQDPADAANACAAVLAADRADLRKTAHGDELTRRPKRRSIAARRRRRQAARPRRRPAEGHRPRALRLRDRRPSTRRPTASWSRPTIAQGTDPRDRHDAAAEQAPGRRAGPRPIANAPEQGAAISAQAQRRCSTGPASDRVYGQPVALRGRRDASSRPARPPTW